MRRRILFAVVAAAAVAGAAVFGAGVSARTKQPLKPQKTFTIGISHYANVLALYRVFTNGAQVTAKKYGFKTIVTDSQFDPGRQTSQIESMITRKVDLIMVSPGDGHALIGAYKAAKKAGIPIMSFANHLATSAHKYELTFYGRLWQDFGALRARVMFKRIGGKGEVIAIRGPHGVSFVDDEKQGFYRAKKKFPGIKVVFDQNAKQFTASEGLRLAQDALAAHPNAKAIYTEGDDLSIGIVRAMKDRGVKLVLAASDGVPATWKLVLNGDVTILLGVPAYQWGLDAMKIAHDYLVLRKKPKDRVLAPILLGTPENAKKLIATTCRKHPRELLCGK